MASDMSEANRGECVSYRNYTVTTPEDRQTTEQRCKELAYDDLHNDGGEGYNPHRIDTLDADATPYHKGG
jgi:hypothetical protein